MSNRDLWTVTPVPVEDLADLRDWADHPYVIAHFPGKPITAEQVAKVLGNPFVDEPDPA